MDREQAAGTEKVGAAYACQGVGHRQVELFDGEYGGVVEGDQGASVVDEVFQGVQTFFADASGVTLRDGAGAIAVHDLARLRIGHHDDIVLFVQASRDDVGVI